MIPSREQADQLVKEYNSEDFHIQHSRIVGGVLAWYAQSHDPGNEDYWYAVGALHDIDYEQFADEHCVKGVELLRAHDVDEGVIRSAMSHGWGMTNTTYQPESEMEKILYAADELTGLIGAVAVMRPSGSVQDLEVKSVKKKFKQPSFAAGVSRETIQAGADKLGWTLDELIEQTIQAMRSLDYVS
ncbi:MAG: HD domain-containing protein [Actinomycetia bacterium]|nr:HD domain-containing protein [Actinomycetes bacterium]